MKHKRCSIILALGLAAWCVLALTLWCAMALTACASPVQAQVSAQDDAAQLEAEGQSAFSQGRYDRAQSAYEKLAKLNPSVAEVHATLAAIDFKERQYSSALREAEIAERLKPNLPRLGGLTQKLEVAGNP